MYISLGDLTLVLVLCLVAVVCIFLAITLYNFISLLKKLNRAIDSNKDSIDKTITAFPNTVKNLNEAAVSFKYTMDMAGSVVRTIDAASIGTVVTVSDTTENILEFVKIVGNVVRYITGVINRGEKD